MAADFADGVAFVSLETLHDPGQLLATVAHALGLPDADGRSGRAPGCPLRSRRLLLVLDTFERVEAAPLLGELLSACPGLTLLVTSRVVLHLSAEHTVRIFPLALPTASVEKATEIAASRRCGCSWSGRKRSTRPSR